MLLELDETGRSLLEGMVRDRLSTLGEGQTYRRDHDWRQARRTRQALAGLLIQLTSTTADRRPVAISETGRSAA